ncbi:MAG: hypothetical protein FWF23_03030 [Alphaproteobacteria bacterium]|nr:hypothetical protein [Alphaproteobacteria bacterium]MCL2504902.1 hypothetical protein [Alphaproteobacteria bacterium]
MTTDYDNDKVNECFAILAPAKTISSRNVPPEQEQAAYDEFVPKQTEIERAIVYLLKAGVIKDVVAVVHTGGPCNPLSYKYDLKNNERSVLLEQIMAEGGTVRCIYNEDQELGKASPPDGVSSEEYKQAGERFDRLKLMYPENFIDNPIADPENKLVTVYSGASYEIDYEDDTIDFISLKSYQAGNIGQGGTRDWALYKGQIDNLPNDVKERYKLIQDIIDEACFQNYQPKKSTDYIKRNAQHSPKG